MGGKSGGNKATISTYYVGIHFVLCHGPIDSIKEIYVDTTRLAWSGINTGTTPIVINKPDLFGGVEREGGVVGNVDICMGGSSQGQNAYLVSKLGINIPSFRGVVSAVLNRVLVGNNYYLKPWGFVGTRVHVRKNGLTQWYDTKAEPITGLINAAHVIRDCLTDTSWGLGVQETLIDDTSFMLAADTLYTEGLAFGFLWDSEISIQDFIVEVCTHIQGTVYVDRTTGKFKLTLQRALTSTSGLIDLNPTNTREVSNFARKSLGELFSSITVKYLDNSTRQQDSVVVTDSALMQRQGGEKNKSITYSGVTSRAMAQRLALRDLGQYSVPLYTATLACNRVAENLNVGDAFTLTWAEDLGTTLIMRVMTINLGTATKGEITITAIQDIFTAANVIYTTPPETTWVDPISTPIAISTRLAFEIPYYIVAQAQGDAKAQAIATTTSFVGIAGVSPTSDSISASMYTTTGSSYAKASVMDFCCSATLNGAINRTVTTVNITNIVDIELLDIDHFIQIDNELMSVTAISGSTLTVVRGVLDTVPETHTSGTRMFGWHSFFGADQTAYLFETVHIKLLTVTAIGTLDIASAPVDNITTIGRMHRPYPPANLQFNSSYFPYSLTTNVAFTITWASRNRFQQTTGLIGWYTGSITPETGITYSSEVRRTDTNAVLDSFTGITALTYTYTINYVGEIEVSVWSVNANGASIQKAKHKIVLTTGLLVTESGTELATEYPISLEY